MHNLIIIRSQIEFNSLEYPFHGAKLERWEMNEVTSDLWLFFFNNDDSSEAIPDHAQI